MSVSASDSFEANSNPYQKCIGIAEKIINSLNDEDIINRYYQMKEKIISSSSQKKKDTLNSGSFIDTDKAYSFYQSLSVENQNLKDELGRISLKKPDFSNSPDNKQIAKILHDMQQKILPSHTIAETGDSIEELESLRKVVEARLESLSYLRNNLKEENSRLKAQYREMSGNVNKKVVSAKEKEEQERIQIELSEQEQRKKLDEMEKKVCDLRNRLSSLTEENQCLLQKHSETTSLLESMKNDTTAAEAQIENMESQSETLFNEIDMLKHSIQVKTKELESLNTLQRFGIDVSENFEISEEIARLREKEEALLTENAQLSFELKRIEKKTKNSSSMDTQTMDEDELAAQILRSKWEK